MLGGSPALAGVRGGLGPEPFRPILLHTCSHQPKTLAAMLGRPPIPYGKIRNFEKLVQGGKGARLKAGVCRDDCYRSVARAVIRKQLRQPGTPTKYRSGTCSATPGQSKRWATLAPIVHAHNARSRAVTAKRRMVCRYCMKAFMV